MELDMQRVSAFLSALVGVALMTSAEVSFAQTARSGGNASAQLLQQMQELASERTTLQAENDKLKKQLADITKDRDALKAGQQAVDRRAKDSAAALQHSKVQSESEAQELTQTKAKMQELIAKFRETVTKMREIEAENTASKQALATSNQRLATCSDRNTGLYHLNDEILAHMKKAPGVFSCAASAEPFTRIARIRNENLADDYHYRAQELERSAPVKAPPASSELTAPPETGAATPPPGPATAPPTPASSPGPDTKADR
jgi:regulator of replication initiation timing